MRVITQTIVASIFLALFVFALSVSIKKQEQYECEKLAEYSKTLKDFYYTDYQKVQCNVK